MSKSLVIISLDELNALIPQANVVAIWAEVSVFDMNLSQKRMKQNDRACKQRERQEIISMTLISDNQPPEVQQAGEKPFDFPAVFIPPQLPAILSFWFRPVAAMWCGQLNAMLFQKIIIELVTRPFA